jgi:hypothetical protein
MLVIGRWVRMGSIAMTLAVVGCAALLAVTVGHAQGPVPERQHTWADSFGAYKSYIRPLSPAATKACERHLHRILKAIDENQACAANSDCVLVSEEPFGYTVPIRMRSAKAVSVDMKQFRDSCNNESIEAGHSNKLVHIPMCVKNRCMVGTSSKR